MPAHDILGVGDVRDIRTNLFHTLIIGRVVVNQAGGDGRPFVFRRDLMRHAVDIRHLLKPRIKAASHMELVAHKDTHAVHGVGHDALAAAGVSRGFDQLDSFENLRVAVNLIEVRVVAQVGDDIQVIVSSAAFRKVRIKQVLPLVILRDRFGLGEKLQLPA